MQTSLSKHRSNLDTETYARFNAILDTTRTKLSQVMESETAEGRARQEQAQNAERAAVSQKSFLQSLNDQVAAFKSSKADIAEYRAAQMGISQQAAPIIARLREQEQAVAREADQKRAAAIASRGLKQALAEQESAERAVAAESRRAAAAQQTFIESLQSQVTAIDKTRSELLELKAAQLGVSSLAAPMIARLRDQENAWKRGEISAGQYRQAMRMLPAQFTDIATSIAGGMPIWMIAIQQGGQIKDSFGGIGNTLKALGGLITPARLLIGGLAAGVTVAAVAAYRGSQEFSEYRKQLILTGDYAGKTAGQLNQLAKSLSGNGVTQGDVASVLAQVVGSGKFDANKIETVTRAAVAMEHATGQAVTETISNFQKLYDSPTRASEELNKQLHYLTSAQYEYISSLERRGDKEQAGEAAADAYSQSQQERAKQVVNSLGWIERAAAGVSKAAKSMWDDLLNLGRQANLQDELSQINDSLKLGVFPRWGDQSETALRARKSLLENVIRAQGVFGDVQSIAKKADDARTDSLVYQNQILSKNMSWKENRARALKELWDNVAKAPDKWTEAQRKLAVAQINQDNKAPSSPKARAYATPAGIKAEDAGQRELLDLQAQLRELQKHTSINDVISKQRLDLHKAENTFAVLEEASRTRQLSKQEQSLLASKDQVLQLARQKALLGDQITAQEQLNKRMDSAQKYATQMAEKTAALNTGSTTSDRLAQRELARSQLRSGWQNAGGSLSDDGYQSELKAAEDYYAAEDALRSNWLAGAKKGWAEYQDSATNVYSSVSQIAQAGLNGLADALTSMVTTGKASIKDFGTSMLKMIVEVINRLLIAYAVQQALGWISAGASASSTAASSNNAFSSGAYNNLSLAYNGGYIPEYDSGGYTGDGGKYEPKGIVHGGEFVFTKEATRRIGVSNLYGMMRGYAEGGVVDGAGMMYGASSSGTAGVNVQTTVNVNTGGDQQQSASQNAALTKAYQQTIDRAVTEGIQKQTGQGGIIWQAMQTR
ncbi:hypothetical protein WB66_05320 [bacteria symbiont BFo1 of Frankliniella occidentalis]|nr:hypothetical protein WB66_05320 [bacteria symbiont BFo1 of Frankliniella occidentalis]